MATRKHWAETEWDAGDELDYHPDNIKAAAEKYDLEEVVRGKLSPDSPADLPENREYQLEFEFYEALKEKI